MSFITFASIDALYLLIKVPNELKHHRKTVFSFLGKKTDGMRISRCSPGCRVECGCRLTLKSAK